MPTLAENISSSTSNPRWVGVGKSAASAPGEAVRAACAEALGQLDGHEVKGVLAFDCIARRGVLGDVGIEREVERISRALLGAPVAGFYSYGEIARTKGTGGFHNEALIVLAVS